MKASKKQDGQVSDHVLIGRCEADPDDMLLTIHFAERAHEPERLVLSVDRQVGAIRLPKQAVRQRDAKIVSLAAHLTSLPPARLAVLSGRQGCGKTSIAEPLRWLLGLERIVDEWHGQAPAPTQGSLVICSESAWRLEGIGHSADKEDA